MSGLREDQLLTIRHFTVTMDWALCEQFFEVWGQSGYTSFKLQEFKDEVLHLLEKFFDGFKNLKEIRMEWTGHLLEDREPVANPGLLREVATMMKTCNVKGSNIRGLDHSILVLQRSLA